MNAKMANATVIIKCRINTLKEAFHFGPQNQSGSVPRDCLIQSKCSVSVIHPNLRVTPAYKIGLLCFNGCRLDGILVGRVLSTHDSIRSATCQIIPPVQFLASPDLDLPGRATYTLLTPHSSTQTPLHFTRADRDGFLAHSSLTEIDARYLMHSLATATTPQYFTAQTEVKRVLLAPTGWCQ